MPSSSNTITVVIPTYNRRALLPLALRSALQQTHRPHEVIVVDDGSSDGTAEYVSRLPAEWGVQLVEQKQAGPSAARNAGIGRATGEYIAFLDSDDLWHPRKLERQLRALEAADASFSYTAAFSFRDRSLLGPYGRTFEGCSGEIFPQIVWRNPVTIPSLLVRVSIFERAGHFDEKLTLGEDSALILRLAHRGIASYDPCPLTYVREHPGRMTRDRRVLEKRYRARERLLTELAEELQASGSERELQLVLHRLAQHQLVRRDESAESVRLDELFPPGLEEARRALLAGYLSAARPESLRPRDVEASPPAIRAYWALRLGGLREARQLLQRRHRPRAKPAALRIVARGAQLEAGRLAEDWRCGLRRLATTARARRGAAQRVLSWLTRPEDGTQRSSDRPRRELA